MTVHKDPSQRIKPCGADFFYIGSGEHSCSIIDIVPVLPRVMLSCVYTVLEDKNARRKVAWTVYVSKTCVTGLGKSQISVSRSKFENISKYLTVIGTG